MPAPPFASVVIVPPVSVRAPSVARAAAPVPVEAGVVAAGAVGGGAVDREVI